MRENLNALPDELRVTCQRAMDGIDSQAQKTPMTATLERAILSFITYALRPIKVAELEHALAVEIGTSMFNFEKVVPRMGTSQPCCVKDYLLSSDHQP